MLAWHSRQHAPEPRLTHPLADHACAQVWKREQAAAAEQRKLEELRKQMEDERKHHEMQELAVAAGHKK